MMVILSFKLLVILLVAAYLLGVATSEKIKNRRRKK